MFEIGIEVKMKLNCTKKLSIVSSALREYMKIKETGRTYSKHGVLYDLLFYFWKEKEQTAGYLDCVGDHNGALRFTSFNSKLFKPA